MHIVLPKQLQQSLDNAVNSDFVKRLIEPPPKVIRSLNIFDWENISTVNEWKAYQGSYILVETDGAKVVPTYAFVIGRPTAHWWDVIFNEDPSFEEAETEEIFVELEEQEKLNREDHVAILVYSMGPNREFIFARDFAYVFNANPHKEGESVVAKVLPTFMSDFASEDLFDDLYQKASDECPHIVQALSKVYQIVDTWVDAKLE